MPQPHQRLEVDREDLMREATALRQRAEYRVPGEPHLVVAGYRGDGALSVYFGPDPCFHFDSERRLRRAFVGGDLYRTQGDKLARLRRIRTSHTVELLRHDLSPDECREFMETARRRLRELAEALQAGDAECIREVSAAGRLSVRLASELLRMVAVPLTMAPVIAGKR